MKLTANFNLEEFRSKDGAAFPITVVDNIKKLAAALQAIRDEINIPIRITSGYRSPEHNRSIGGATNSTHLRGLGADIASSMPPAKLAAVIEKMIAEGKIPAGGLKAYSGWVHYDIRGTNARW